MSEAALLGEAAAADRADPLRDYREHFALPQTPDGRPLCYLSGHSLGLAPKAARARLEEALGDWEQRGVLGHEQGHAPWIDYAEPLRVPLAALCGAQPDEVVAMNSLSVNLHLLLASFYRPSGARRQILIEAGAFPSDRHVVTSQLQWHGIDPAQALIELAPRPGEMLLRDGDILEAIARAGEQLALVLWPGVQYRTGQAFDLFAIASATRRAGAVLGVDLAHSIGNLPLALHQWGVDFAAWCSYKYLNAGPGAIGGAFVHQRHARNPQQLRLAGWWGTERATRFKMPREFLAAAGAAGWQVSNPPIFSCAPLAAALAEFSSAGLGRLRAKSLALTGFLERSLQTLCGRAIKILTPADPTQRGCQLSVALDADAARARRVYELLEGRGVIVDWREPNVVRMAPVPLYNSFADAVRASQALAGALRDTH
ncbi:MAG: kynureninase [Steroidobacteraceae bacterium]|jgi:kynureninase